VVQISDGAVQSAGVTVRVKAVGQSEADGGGTTAYSTDGIVIYTPTQAETNYTSFVLIAKKTGCIPASVTVVTSESTVSGRVYVQTNGDKTGYALTQTFPANFAALGINGSGHVERVVLVDTTTTNTDMRGTDNALLAASYTAAPSAASNATAVRTELTTELGRIDATVSSRSTFAGGAVASVTAGVTLTAGTVTDIQSGLATSANQTVIIDRVTWGLTALVGACSDAQTAAETYTLSIGGSTFTVDYSGLDSSGNRSTTTLSKA